MFEIAGGIIIAFIVIISAPVIIPLFIGCSFLILYIAIAVAIIIAFYLGLDSLFGNNVAICIMVSMFAIGCIYISVKEAYRDGTLKKIVIDFVKLCVITVASIVGMYALIFLVFKASIFIQEQYTKYIH